MVLADLFHSHHWIDLRDWLGVLATAAAAIFAAVSIRQASAARAKAIQDAIEERRKDYTLASLRDIHKAVIRSAGTTRDFTWRLDLDQAILACPLRMPLTRAAFHLGATDEEQEAFNRYAMSSRGGAPWGVFERAVSIDEIARATLDLVDPDRTTATFESLQERVEDQMRKRYEESQREVSPQYQEPSAEPADDNDAPQLGASE